MQQGIQHYVKRQLFSIQNILKGVLTLILANVAIHSFALTTADNSVANDIKPVILKATKSVAHPAPPLEMAKPHLIQNRYLIEFDEPSFAEFETVQTKNRLNKTQKQAKQKTILSKQEEHIKQLQKQLPSLRINQRFTQLFNGVEVEIEKAHVKALKSLKHVKRVYPVKLRYLSLDASQQIIKAQVAWEAVGGQSKAGEGIKIAIVDTGIRNNNPMFNDEGIKPLDLSGNTHLNNNPDYCRSETGSADFCNNKIVIARWVDPILFGLDIYEQEYMSPMDFDGHGTHVAGIAAGRALSVNFNNANVDISGVAPASHLMIYKALYTSPFGGAYATDTMLLQALEWAVSDGADVINNSWGAGSGEDPDSSVYQTVFNNAESLGIVVVNAAGNTGHPGATINCPACIESGIAVANSTHGRFFGHAIATSEGTVYGYPGQAEPLLEDVNLNAVALRLLEPDNANGCAPITEAIPDSAAVVIAYTPFCPLSMSVQHASDAGAKLVLAYFDDVFGQAIYEPLLPFADDYAIGVLGLSQTAGLQLEAIHEANGDSSIVISSLVEANVETEYADIVNPFSSTGPNNDPNYLKPDLAAPGTNILSAYSPDEFSFAGFPPGGDELPSPSNNDPVFATLTGTSMASPHVAGAAALLKQQHPQWSAAQIKSALVNTAESNVLLGSEIAGPFEKGAGRLDLERAMAPTLSFSQVSFSDPACIASCELEFTVTNLTTDNQEWTLTTDFNNSLVHAMVNPASFSLSAEASQVINITVDVSNADPAHPLYNQWEFGRLLATSANGLQLSMPIVANANDSSDQGSLLVFHDASDLQSSTSVPFTVRTRNLGELDEVNLNVQISDNAKVLVNSEAVELRNGEAQTLTVNDNSIQWQGVLAQGAMLLEDNSLWNDYLLSEQEVSPIACDEGCGFVNAVVEFDFQFNGNHYQTLTLSDNGFVVPGNQNFGFITALFNQSFPQQDQLNNVIAPFWTEFDLLDVNVPSDTGGGYLRAAVRVVDDVNYLIVEWDNVVPYSLPEDDEGEIPTDPFPEDPIPEDPLPEDPAPEDPLPEDPLPEDPLPEDPAPDLPDSPPTGGDPLDSETESFTFQLIIEENTDNIWFKYYNIPYLPEALSIGAENEDGRVGINYHFDGTGNDVFISQSESSKTMKLTTVPEGRSIITFDVELHGEQDYAQPDSYNLMEDTEASLPVLDNDHDYSFATITSDTGADSIFSAVSSAKIPATGGLDSNSLTIMVQPTNGIATVEDGAVLYQPNADYFGADLFSYQVADAAGDHISSTNVALEISSVNDAPVIGEINAGSDFVVSENQMLSFTVPASDVDSETLSLSINATSNGVTPTFTIDGMQVNMNGLSVSQDTSIQLQLVVSDGIDDSAPVTVNISVENEDSGGSLAWLLALLLSCCGRRITGSRH